MGVFWSAIPLDTKPRARLVALLGHFTSERLRKIVLPLTSSQSPLSLRTLDWLVINYARRKKLILLTRAGHLVDVYEEYRTALRYWQRSMFDAFRRGPRIYTQQDGEIYPTTVGQLNYLFWCESVGVLDYANQHRRELETDMAERVAKARGAKRRALQETGTSRRCELSESPDIKCQIIDAPVVLRVWKKMRV